MIEKVESHQTSEIVEPVTRFLEVHSIPGKQKPSKNNIIKRVEEL